MISEATRRQLEGDAEILIAAHARYRELWQKLGGPLWRRHLARCRQIAGVLVEAGPAICAALRAAERRADAVGLASRVEAERQAVATLASDRLSSRIDLPLIEALSLLQFEPQAIEVGRSDFLTLAAARWGGVFVAVIVGLFVGFGLS